MHDPTSNADLFIVLKESSYLILSYLIKQNLCVPHPLRRKTTVSLETKTFLHLWRCERIVCADVLVLTVVLSLVLR